MIYIEIGTKTLVQINLGSLSTSDECTPVFRTQSLLLNIFLIYIKSVIKLNEIREIDVGSLEKYIFFNKF